MSTFNAGFFESGCDIIPLINQGDGNGAALTGDWVKVRDYARVGFLLAKYGSEDVDDGSLQFLQGTDATGAGSKALSLPANRPFWYKTGTLTSQTVWTKSSITTAVDGLAFGSSVPSGSTRAIADVNTSALLLYTELLATDLDVDSGFDWVTAYLGNNANNALLFSAWAVLQGGRYPQVVPLSSIS
jgi:hypothetical protein